MIPEDRQVKVEYLDLNVPDSLGDTFEVILGSHIVCSESDSITVAEVLVSLLKKDGVAYLVLPPPFSSDVELNTLN